MKVACSFSYKLNLFGAASGSVMSSWLCAALSPAHLYPFLLIRPTKSLTAQHSTAQGEPQQGGHRKVTNCLRGRWHV